MAFMNAITPRRAQKACVKKTWAFTIWQQMVQRWKHRNHPGLPPMNIHIARDVGLSDFELARCQHQWPSQTTHHPRS